MKNSDKPAMPLFSDDGEARYDLLGLTKREHFAAMAMQGLMSNLDPKGEDLYLDIAVKSTLMADALLKELEQ